MVLDKWGGWEKSHWGHKVNSVLLKIHLSCICSGNNSIADISGLEMLRFGEDVGRLSSPATCGQLDFYRWFHDVIVNPKIKVKSKQSCKCFTHFSALGAHREECMQRFYLHQSCSCNSAV